MAVKFERHKRNRMSLTAVMTLFIVVALIVMIPKMIIGRADSVITNKLDNTQDTTFIKLYKAADSYLQTAEKFPLSGERVTKLEKELKQKGEERLNFECQKLKMQYKTEKTDYWWQNTPQDTLKAFCEKWGEIIPQETMAKYCPFCLENN